MLQQQVGDLELHIHMYISIYTLCYDSRFFLFTFILWNSPHYVSTGFRTCLGDWRAAARFRRDHFTLMIRVKVTSWTSHFQLETPRTNAIHMYFLDFWGDALSFWPWETQPVKQPWRDPHIADRLFLQGHHREPLWHRAAWLHCCNQGFQIIFSACTVKMSTTMTIWY